MADLERTYNVPLRKEFLKVPRYKRAKKAVTALREFLMKHMKAETILLGQEVNHEIWAHGIKNPPHHVKVTAIKDSEGIVRAELQGFDFAVIEQKAKKEEDTSLMGKLKSKMGVPDEEEEEKPKEKKVKKPEEVKKEEKPISEKKDVPEKKAEATAPKKEAPEKKAEEKKPKEAKPAEKTD